MSQDRTAILVLEDDEGLRRQLKWALSEYKVLPSATRPEALNIFRVERPPIAIVDLGLPPNPDGASEGLAAMEEMVRIAPETKVIIASGNEAREHALRAVALGAYDFYKKPIDIEELRIIIGRAIRLYDLECENRALAAAAPTSAIQGIVGASPVMSELLRKIEKIAPTNVSVMLCGESGTGKEMLAKAIHQLSPRARRPFVAINCAAIPETLLESELFGYEKGAFTGAVKQTIGKIESAHRGTIFLDEIGDIPLSMQAKLLRFLQDQVVERLGGRQSLQVDVRIICATHRNLERMIAEGQFRDDLYYRLNEVPIIVPPLRERVGDAVLLANFFMSRYSAEFNRPAKAFTSDAVAAIRTNPWRGNVRELEHRVKRAVVMSDGHAVTATDLDLTLPESASISLNLRDARSRAEQEVIRMAISHADGNMSKAAKLLGVSRPTLYDLVAEHGLASDSK